MIGMGSRLSVGGLEGGDSEVFAGGLLLENTGGGATPMPMCIPIPPLILAIRSRIAIRLATSGSISGSIGSKTSSAFVDSSFSTSA